MKRLIALLSLLACQPTHGAFINACSEWESVLWRDRVQTNSATLSGAAYIAGTRYMIQIKTWGVRPYKKRVNLYVGSNTNAAQVCIIHDWATGTVDGADKWIAFASGDFSESSGLTGNTSTKYILPNGYQGADGLHLVDLTTATNLHMATYVRTGTNESSILMGFQGPSPFPAFVAAVSFADVTYLQMGVTFTNRNDTNGVGLYLHTRNSTTSASLYKNGSEFLRQTNSETATLTGTTLVCVHAWTKSSPTLTADFTSRTLSYYAFGTALPAELAKPDYDAVQNVQLMMGRAK